MTIREAFEAFEIDELVSEDRTQNTIDSYRSTCNSFVRALGHDIDVALLSYIHIIQWKKHMIERNNATSHVAFQLRELRRVLSYLKRHSFATLDPTEIKIPSFKYNKTAWFTIEEIRRFISVMESPRDKALFACLFSSGTRISELIGLKRDSIKNGVATVYGKGRKNGKDEPEIITFDSNALMLLDEYMSTRVDDLDYLFISRQNRQISINQCINLVHKYIEMACIEKNGRGATHILRHSFATDLEIKGLGIHGIATQMRHKKLDTTRIYLHGSHIRKQTDYRLFHTPVPLSDQSTSLSTG